MESTQRRDKFLRLEENGTRTTYTFTTVERASRANDEALRTIQAQELTSKLRSLVTLVEKLRADAEDAQDAARWYLEEELKKAESKVED